MKILYAIQGTGNGHVSRAKILVPLLMAHAEVDVLISGQHFELSLPFDVKYRFRGFGFYFGKNGGIDYQRTLQNINLTKLIREIEEVPVESYDVILNDFEPVSAWAAKKHKIPCIALSHQCSLLFKGVPRIQESNRMGELILKHYAPADWHIGFHFCQYTSNVFLPVLRETIRNAKVTNDGHYTVYLPSYSDEKIIEILAQVSNVRWEVFSKHNKNIFTSGNVTARPVEEESFTQSMISAEGILCGAGFETPAEAIHLGKKLLVIPMKNQYEQLCNAEALFRLGIPVVKKLNNKNIAFIRQWTENEQASPGPYEDQKVLVIEHIIKMIKQMVPSGNWVEYSLI